MPIRIKCPECESQYDVDEAKAGKTGRCKCGSLIAIPEQAAEEVAVAQLPEEEVAVRMKGARKRSSRKRWSLIFLGIVLCTGGAALAGFTMMQVQPVTAYLAIGLGLIVLGISMLIASSR